MKKVNLNLCLVYFVVWNLKYVSKVKSTYFSVGKPQFTWQ